MLKTRKMLSLLMATIMLLGMLPVGTAAEFVCEKANSSRSPDFIRAADAKLGEVCSLMDTRDEHAPVNFHMSNMDYTSVTSVEDGGTGYPSSTSMRYTYLGITENSGMYSCWYLIDYPEEFVTITAQSSTWFGGLIALISASIDEDEQTSDLFDSVCNTTYEGQTGGIPVGEAGEIYINGGVYLKTFDFGGVQLGGNFHRFTVRLNRTPSFSQCLQDENGYYLPIGLEMLEFTYGIYNDQGILHASLDWCKPENIDQAPWLSWTSGKLYISRTSDNTVSTPYKLSPGDDPSGVFHTHFSDDWFTVPSDEFNYELAKASLAASAGSFSLDHNPTDEYVRETLQAFGFTDGFEPHKFDNNTAIENTCGHAFAYKVLPNGDYLIAAAIRSSGYGSEWESNFNVMPDNNAYMYSLGFKQAADGVYLNLDGYINRLCSARGISRGDICVWTFGFSRGGAVANLLAARLNQESDIPQSQIYAYTFATPKTVLRDAQIKYGNIFNIVQETDAVPHVPLRTWDYTWYGNNYYLPSRTKTGRAFAGKLEAMTACFQRLMNESGRDDVHYSLGATQELTIDLLLDYVDDVIRSRFYYRDRGWQDIMRSVGEKMGEAGDFDIATLLRLLVPNAWYALNALFEEWDYLSFTEKVSELRELLAALTNYKTLLTNNPAGEVVGMLIDFMAHYLGRFLLQAVSFNMLSTTDNYDYLFALLGDTFRNGKSGDLFMQHWPETYMAWLNSASDASLFERSSYKRVSLKCPIDVYVYDSNGNLVGSIVDDVVDNTIAESVYCACDMLGEKTVYLPDDDTYRIEIVAREDCDFDLVNEYYTEESELVSIECYLDVPAGAEEVFESDYVLDEQECTLSDSGMEIEADFVSEPGEEIPEFKVELNCEGYGVAAGDGYYTLGETVSLSAVEIYGSTFIGWFDGNGELVSTETVYNYSIISDGAFTAVFEGGVRPGDVDCNGAVNAADALMVLRLSLGLIDEIDVSAADVDGNGIVNVNDALIILRAALGLTTF